MDLLGPGAVGSKGVQERQPALLRLKPKQLGCLRRIQAHQVSFFVRRPKLG